VATIKPSSGGNAIPSISTPTGSRTINVSARNLIEQAYRIPWTFNLNERVVGGPDWIDTIRYNVDARIDPALADALQKMSNEQQKIRPPLHARRRGSDEYLPANTTGRTLGLKRLLTLLKGM
jgi:uncharacterized protein (TIGR03435 family)